MESTSQQGGYRKPETPAVVSGPGALSQRTDGSPSQPATYIAGLPQGQGEATYNQQLGASMYQAPQVDSIRIGAFDTTPLTAESKNKDEDILTGASFIKDGFSALTNLPYQQPSMMTILGKIAQQDPTGDTELVMRIFEDRGII